MEVISWRYWLKLFRLPSISLGLLGLVVMINLYLAEFWLAAWIFAWGNLVLLHGFYLFFIGIRFKAKTRMNWQQRVFSCATYPLLLFFSCGLFAITATKVGHLGMHQFSRPTILKSEQGFVDYRGQIHVHSFLSDDASPKGTFQKIARDAKVSGISWIILTDHVNKLPPGNYPNEVDGVLFIYGCEEDWKEEKASRFWASLLDSRRDLKLLGHLEDFGWSGTQHWESADAIELVNFHANSIKFAKEILKCLFFDPKYTYQTLTNILPQNLRYWHDLAVREGRPIPIFAGPDAHQNVGVLGVQLDPYQLMLSLVSTHIWIEEGKPLNQENVFQAIKKGRTYIAFDYLGESTGFQFWSESEDEKKNFTGDIVKCPKRLMVKNPVPSGTRVKFIHNNQFVYFDSFIENPEPGFWRVEIWRDGYPWIISGQILVK